MLNESVMLSEPFLNSLITDQKRFLYSHENFVEAQRQNSIIVMHPPFQFCSLYISKNTGMLEDISLAGDANVF